VGSPGAGGGGGGGGCPGRLLRPSVAGGGLPQHPGGGVAGFKEARRSSRGRRKKLQSRPEENTCDGLAVTCGGADCSAAACASRRATGARR
jgi:hypothetical protein